MTSRWTAGLAVVVAVMAGPVSAAAEPEPPAGPIAASVARLSDAALMTVPVLEAGEREQQSDPAGNLNAPLGGAGGGGASAGRPGAPRDSTAARSSARGSTAIATAATIRASRAH